MKLLNICDCRDSLIESYSTYQILSEPRFSSYLHVFQCCPLRKDVAFPGVYCEVYDTSVCFDLIGQQVRLIRRNDVIVAPRQDQHWCFYLIRVIDWASLFDDSLAIFG